MPSAPTRSRKSAVPTFYYVVFGIIEPLVTLASLLEGTLDPWKMINSYGPVLSGFVTEAAEDLPPAVRTIICQAVVAHAVIGLLIASVLRAIRRLPSPALQEKIAKSLMISLAIGDVLHLFGTFYGIGDIRWKVEDWPQVLWLNIIVGLALFIPRVCWLLGIGRFVATRDSRLDGKD